MGGEGGVVNSSYGRGMKGKCLNDGGGVGLGVRRRGMLRGRKGLVVCRVL